MFEENTIIGQISKGKYPEKTIETKYGEFTVRFPSGMDYQVIARKVAACYGGMPVNSFATTVQYVNDRDMTLSEVIMTYPDKFPGKWKHEGIVDFPDEEVKNVLFKSFNTFYTENQKKISGKPGEKPSEG